MIGPSMHALRLQRHRGSGSPASSAIHDLVVVAMGFVLAACTSMSTAIPPTATPSASPTPTATASATAMATATALATASTPAGCPAAPTTAAEMIHIGMFMAASCFGQSDLTVDGYTLDCGGCGGVDEYDRTPSWLAMFIPAYFLGPNPGEPGIDPTAGFPFFVDPALGLTVPPPDTMVHVTGHFNDPIALTCQVVPKSGTSAPALDPNEVIASCQASFVVTAVSVVTP
jgi:hypothetical protein